MSEFTSGKLSGGRSGRGLERRGRRESPGHRRRLRRLREERLLLESARRIARRIAAAHPLRVCTVDRVARRLLDGGHTGQRVQRVSGNIFRGPEWLRTPWRKAHRASRRTREVRVWRLRAPGEMDPPSSLCDRAFLSYSLSARGAGLRRDPPLEALIECADCRAEHPIGLLVEGDEGLVCLDCRRDR